MSFVTRQAAHCDQCGHEWLVVAAKTPTHCAKCRSRKWNMAGGDSKRVDLGSQPKPAPKPDMQALRDICAGKLPQGAIGFAVHESLDHPHIMEVAICGKQWWEDGEHYECLMDAGHREQKHGMRGMVRVIS